MDKNLVCAFLLLVKTGLIFGYPYAQLIPLRSIVNQYPYRSPVSELSLGFARPSEAPCPCARGGSSESTCPCMRDRGSRPRGQCSSCQQRDYDFTSPLQIGEISIPRRVIRSVVDTDTPVIESVPLAPSVEPFAEDNLKFVRSVLDLVIPLLSRGQTQIAGNSAPEDNSNPSTPTNSEKTGTKDCPTHGYGMSYTNLQVEVKEEARKEEPSAAEESREKKIEEQQNQILDYLDQLSQGQMATMMAQLDTEMMTEQEFVLQESYLREIKHQLNSLRAAGEARDKLMTSMRTTSAPVSHGSVVDTTTPTSDIPDTTSALPATESVPTESPIIARAA